MGGVRHQADAANVLFALGLGPRLFDVVELSSGATQMTGFVVEHVTGTTPSQREHAAFLARLTDLLHGELRDAVALATPWQLQHMDFAAPDCNGNLIRRQVDGQLTYVDFQPFMLIHRGRIVEHLLLSTGLATDGPAFAAQVAAAARRWQSVSRVLHARGVQPAGRLVLDLACELGLVLASALASGARWGIGWTASGAARDVARVQSVWGNTRLTVQPARGPFSGPLLDDIPEALQPELAEAIVLHAGPGADPGLATLPWRILVCEGTHDHAERDHCRLLTEVHALEDDGNVRRLSVFVRD
jgi:hypothetical protein